MYADNTSLINRDSEMQTLQNIEDEIGNLVHYWYKNNLLSVNHIKTQKLNSSNDMLAKGDTANLLGITLDDSSIGVHI
ncbi:hypothetical protein JTB14_018296 [Gonioctena quinquepunctata]|nr:hypothetical protein JTB14_018296 [Gonioctena quinquepunctata]